MTNPLFFDTDCISAFLWANEQNIVATLYPGSIVIPKQVYDELSYPGVSHLRAKIDLLISTGQAQIEQIDVGTSVYETYMFLTTPNANVKLIGKGEAAVIAMAKEHDGVVASNNLKDIVGYVKQFNLKHITTGDILVEALNRNIITETQGNQIWNDMLKKRRKLGASSFSEYLKMK